MISECPVCKVNPFEDPRPFLKPVSQTTLNSFRKLVHRNGTKYKVYIYFDTKSWPSNWCKLQCGHFLCRHCSYDFVAEIVTKNEQTGCNYQVLIMLHSVHCTKNDLR